MDSERSRNPTVENGSRGTDHEPHPARAYTARLDPASVAAATYDPTTAHRALRCAVSRVRRGAADDQLRADVERHHPPRGCEPRPRCLGREAGANTPTDLLATRPGSSPAHRGHAPVAGRIRDHARR